MSNRVQGKVLFAAKHPLATVKYFFGRPDAVKRIREQDILRRDAKTLSNYLDSGYLLNQTTLERIAKATELNVEQLSSYVDDLSRNKEFVNSILSDIMKHGTYAMISSPADAVTLYVLVRALKPETVVETGVASGVSSAFILRALADNRSGRLHSIDLPKQYLLPPGVDQPGWRVPTDIRNRWSLKLGRTSDLLGGILSELREVDIFFHDSDHSYQNMTFEFSLAWEHLKTAGLLIADDTDENTAFDDFAVGKMVSPVIFPTTVAGRKRGLAMIRKV